MQKEIQRQKDKKRGNIKMRKEIWISCETIERKGTSGRLKLWKTCGSYEFIPREYPNFTSFAFM